MYGKTNGQKKLQQNIKMKILIKEAMYQHFWSFASNESRILSIQVLVGSRFMTESTDFLRIFSYSFAEL